MNYNNGQPLRKLIIIPAYNEACNIENTVEMIREKAGDFDYVIINDCSKDKTREICESKGYNLVNLPINLGIGGAVQTGYKYAFQNNYDIAVQVDGDGQHDPGFLSDMLDYLLRNKLNMVIGSRFIEKEGFQTSAVRRVGINYFTNIIKLLTGKVITDPTSGLRMADRKTIRLFARDYPRDYPEPESIVKLLKLGGKVGEIPVIMKERQGGASSISPIKSVYYMIKVTLAILFV